MTSDISSVTDLLGKSVTDLQSNVSVDNDSISGTLNYISSYPGFSGNVEEQSGHYLALFCDSDDAETITVELVGGVHGPVTLDEDGLIILKVTSPTQSVRVIATADDGSTTTKVYSLTNLQLASNE